MDSREKGSKEGKRLTEEEKFRRKNSRGKERQGDESGTEGMIELPWYSGREGRESESARRQMDS